MPKTLADGRPVICQHHWCGNKANFFQRNCPYSEALKEEEIVGCWCCTECWGRCVIAAKKPR